MSKLFHGFTYELSQNIIKYDNDITKLKHHSLVFCIANVIRETSEQLEGYITNFSGWSIDEDDLLVFDQLWEEAGRFIEDELDKNIKSMSCELRLNQTYIQRTIEFMGVQIIEFIVKKPFCTRIKVSDFLSRFVFTSQGTINLSKSVLRVIKEYSHVEKERSQIFFYHFMEKEIEIDKNIPENLQLNVISVKEDLVNDYSIYFWSLKLNDGRRPSIPVEFNTHPDYKYWLDPSITNENVYINIFFIAVDTNNETAVEYLWINEISKIKSRDKVLNNVLIKIVNNYTKTNIFMYLLFQVNENELFEKFFKMKSFNIIEKIIKEIRWNCLFLKVFKTLEIYIDKKFILIFELLARSHCRVSPAGINLDIVIDFFSSLDETLKMRIINDAATCMFSCSYERILTKALINNDKKLIKKLRIEKHRVLEAFLKTEHGLDSLTKAFEKGEIDHIYEGLQDFIIENPKDVFNYFFNKRKEILREYFLTNSLFNKFMLFVDLYSGSEKDIANFKLKTLEMSNGVLIRGILFPPGDKISLKIFELADSVLKWCLESDSKVSEFKEMMNFKRAKYNPKNKTIIIYFDKIKECLLNSEFKFITKLFTWKGIEFWEKNNILMEFLQDADTIKRVDKLNNTNSFLNNFTRFLKYHGILDGDINRFKKHFQHP